MTPFNTNLRATREKAGMTRQELADSIGISVSALGQYEQGRREPDLQKLVTIAAALHVSVDDLLGYHVNAFDYYASMLAAYGYDVRISPAGFLSPVQTIVVEQYFPENGTKDFICAYTSEKDFITDMHNFILEYEKSLQYMKKAYLFAWFNKNINDCRVKVISDTTTPAPDHDDADDKPATEKGPHAKE